MRSRGAFGRTHAAPLLSVRAARSVSAQSSPVRWALRFYQQLGARPSVDPRSPIGATSSLPVALAKVYSQFEFADVRYRAPSPGGLWREFMTYASKPPKLDAKDDAGTNQSRRAVVFQRRFTIMRSRISMQRSRSIRNIPTLTATAAQRSARRAISMAPSPILSGRSPYSRITGAQELGRQPKAGVVEGSGAERAVPHGC